MTQVADEATIRQLVDLFTERWNWHDGDACARPFTDGADFTNIMELKAYGRKDDCTGARIIMEG